MGQQFLRFCCRGDEFQQQEAQHSPESILFVSTMIDIIVHHFSFLSYGTAHDASTECAAHRLCLWQNLSEAPSRNCRLEFQIQSGVAYDCCNHSVSLNSFGKHNTIRNFSYIYSFSQLWHVCVWCVCSFFFLLTGTTMLNKSGTCDIIAQKIDDPDGQLDLTRTFKFTLFLCCLYWNVSTLCFQYFISTSFPGRRTQNCSQKDSMWQLCSLPFRLSSELLHLQEHGEWQRRSRWSAGVSCRRAECVTKLLGVMDSCAVCMFLLCATHFQDLVQCWCGLFVGRGLVVHVSLLRR